MPHRPFYNDPVTNNWYKLTYHTYPMGVPTRASLSKRNASDSSQLILALVRPRAFRQTTA